MVKQLNKDCVNTLKQNGHPVVIVAAVGEAESNNQFLRRKRN